jgi:hypothetical protein
MHGDLRTFENHALGGLSGHLSVESGLDR